MAAAWPRVVTGGEGGADERAEDPDQPRARANALGRRGRRAAGVRPATALTLGPVVAGSSAYAQGVSLGIIEPRAYLSIRLTHHGWHGYSGDPMSLVVPEPQPAAEAA